MLRKLRYRRVCSDFTSERNTYKQLSQGIEVPSEHQLTG
jgi:hypothetical protein